MNRRTVASWHCYQYGSRLARSEDWSRCIGISPNGIRQVGGLPIRDIPTRRDQSALRWQSQDAPVERCSHLARLLQASRWAYAKGRRTCIKALTFTWPVIAEWSAARSGANWNGGGSEVSLDLRALSLTCWTPPRCKNFTRKPNPKVFFLRQPKWEASWPMTL